MYCRKCGAEIKETSKFCDNCGCEVVKVKQVSYAEKYNENKKKSKKQKLAFTDFIHARHNRSETIAAFLALLELLRLKQISIQQDGAFSPIYITERKETAHGDIETGTA